MEKIHRAIAIFLISSEFNFLNRNFIPKNKIKNIKAKTVSDVCVKVTAVMDSAIIIQDLSKLNLITLQKNKTRKAWESREGQCPHKKPVDGGNENMSIDSGNDNKAIVLLKFLIIKYITNTAIMEKNVTIKYIES